MLLAGKWSISVFFRTTYIFECRSILSFTALKRASGLASECIKACYVIDFSTVAEYVVICFYIPLKLKGAIPVWLRDSHVSHSSILCDGRYLAKWLNVWWLNTSASHEFLSDLSRLVPSRLYMTNWAAFLCSWDENSSAWYSKGTTQLLISHVTSFADLDVLQSRACIFHCLKAHSFTGILEHLDLPPICCLQVSLEDYFVVLHCGRGQWCFYVNDRPLHIIFWWTNCVSWWKSQAGFLVGLVIQKSLYEWYFPIMVRVSSNFISIFASGFC